MLWARAEIEKRGKSVEGPAVRELIQRTGTRLSDVSNAVNLVCNYIGGNAAVTEADADGHYLACFAQEEVPA